MISKTRSDRHRQARKSITQLGRYRKMIHIQGKATLEPQPIADHAQMTAGNGIEQITSAHRIAHALAGYGVA